MLSVEDWAEIRRLRRSERLPISEIARVLKISRNTVKSALASDGPPKYQRAAHQTISDPEHVVAAKLLRRKRFDIVGPPHHVEVEQRLLTTYDTVLGLDGPVA